MTSDQADQIIAALALLHQDNLTAQVTAITLAGYMMHLHEVAEWILYALIILGMCFIAFQRPRERKH